MGSKDKDRARAKSDRAQRRSEAREDATFGQMQRERGSVIGQDVAERSNLLGQYQTGAQHGWVDDEQRKRGEQALSGGLEALRSNKYGGGGGGGGGGYEASYTGPGSETQEGIGGYRDFMGSGGVDMGALTENLGIYKDIAARGGYTGGGERSIRENIERMGGAARNIQGAAGDVRGAGVESMGMREGWQGLGDKYGAFGGIGGEEQARMRGGGVYDEFARTGGIDANMAQNIRARGNAPIESMYAGGQRALDREAAMRGGQGFGGASAAARNEMMRGMGQNLADASRGTELGLARERNQGRLQGAAGMAGTEGALQGRLSENQLASLAGQAGALGGEQSAIAQAGGLYGQAGGLHGMAGNLYGDAAGRMTGLEQNLVGNRLGAATAWGNQQAKAQQLAQQGKMFGTQGLTEAGQYQDALAQQEAKDRQAAGERAAAQEGANYKFNQGLEADYAARIADDAARWGGARQAGRTGAVGGLHDLYAGGRGGTAQEYDRMMLAGAGQFGGEDTTRVGENVQIGHMPTTGSRWVQGLGAAGGILGGLSSGGITGGLLNRGNKTPLTQTRLT